jgi:hypothetical protein
MLRQLITNNNYKSNNIGRFFNTAYTIIEEHSQIIIMLSQRSNINTCRKKSDNCDARQTNLSEHWVTFVYYISQYEIPERKVDRIIIDVEGTSRFKTKATMNSQIYLWRTCSLLGGGHAFYTLENAWYESYSRFSWPL